MEQYVKDNAFFLSLETKKFYIFLIMHDCFM